MISRSSRELAHPRTGHDIEYDMGLGMRIESQSQKKRILRQKGIAQVGKEDILANHESLMKERSFD